MVDRDEAPSGKINWPAVIVVSVAVHAVALGIFWLFSEEKSDAPADEAVAESGGTDAAAPERAPETGSSVERPQRQPAEGVPAPAGQASGQSEYTVVRGDNLSKIAEKFGCTVDGIKKASNLESDNLQIGQKLKIPAKHP
ncbi:MAG: LysM peptidoglycan-binding domain-containing protein [Kiritimatiellae bacterium]|nr:LysM peptidoglycan-binding domain-containing protein [Kiritimatiellia bacterium]